MKLRIYVLSSVVPDAKGFGGPLVLHRYLSAADYEVRVFRWRRFPSRLGIIGKLNQIGLRWLGRCLECLSPVLPRPAEIDAEIREFQPDVILTVAHGWLHLAAAGAARRNRIALVTFFQDWWPDFEEVPRFLRKRAEKAIRETARESTRVICVSQGMFLELGAPANAVVIHDVPSSLPPSPRLEECAPSPLKLVYFGNLTDYGPMVEMALSAMAEARDVELHVYGRTPAWSSGAEKSFKIAGRYHGSVGAEELNRLIPGFDAILVTMSFAPPYRRRMATSFLSKLIEGTQHGLPIVIWGPEDCSAVRWAREGGKALCVTEPDAGALLDGVRELLDPRTGAWCRYRAKARESAAREFCPDLIRKQFHAVLTGSASDGRDAHAAEGTLSPSDVETGIPTKK